MKIRKNMTYLSCLLIGWNPEILKSCTESSYKQLRKYTSAFIILIIIWATVGYLFAKNYAKLDSLGSIIVAFIAVTIVIQIERQIILTWGKNNWGKIFRIIIAFLMAIIGSTILDQIFFKDDIEKKMIEIVEKEVQSQLPLRLNLLDKKLALLQNDKEKIFKRNLILNEEINKNPTIKTVETQTTRSQIKDENGNLISEPTITTIIKPIANPRINEVNINNENLKKIEQDISKYNDLKLKSEENLRNELKEKKGFLQELNALFNIILGSLIAGVFYIVLFIFLMSLELFVVLSKTDKNKCDYDLIIEHQLNQKKETILELSKKSLTTQ